MTISSMTVSALSVLSPATPSYEVAPVRAAVRYVTPLKKIPADFFADPDGDWDWETLVREAGFEESRDSVAIGALTAPYMGHPAGSAVVTLNSKSRPYVAIIECAPLPQEIGRILEESESAQVA